MYRGIPNKYPPPSINDRVPNSKFDKFSLINDRRNSARAARKFWHFGDFRRGYPYEITAQINDRDQIGVSKISLINDQTQIAQILDH